MLLYPLPRVVVIGRADSFAAPPHADPARDPTPAREPGAPHLLGGRCINGLAPPAEGGTDAIGGPPHWFCGGGSNDSYRSAIDYI